MTPADTRSEVAASCAGKKRKSERVELRDGRHLAREWGERRRLIEETGARGEGLIPWNLFDPIRSVGSSPASPQSQKARRPRSSVNACGWPTSINAHEPRQLVLLFGTHAAAREELRRDAMDLQVITDPEKQAGMIAC